MILYAEQFYSENKVQILPFSSLQYFIVTIKNTEVYCRRNSEEGLVLVRTKPTRIIAKQI
jgi:hypothetical protein